MIQGLAQHVRNVMMAKDPQTLPLLETSDDQKAKFQAQAQKAPTPFLYKALELMNQCDIHYRASSNKRLLVELTLIQIGQITQPEDQDVPSAGRTPNRLKSLFQKLLAQSKLASQGAGSELLAAAKTGHHSRERLLLLLLLCLRQGHRQPLLQPPMLHLILHLPPQPHLPLQKAQPLPELLLMLHRLTSHDSRISSWEA